MVFKSQYFERAAAACFSASLNRVSFAHNVSSASKTIVFILINLFKTLNFRAAR